MNIIIKKGPDALQTKKAHPISDEEIKKGLKDGTIKHVGGTMYAEVESEYQTKDMTAAPKKKVARKKKAKDEDKGE